MKNNKSLSLFRLIMINIIAVTSLRNISITAKAGWMIITLYIVAGMLFLLPYTLIMSKMYKEFYNSGPYLWCKNAFGYKFGLGILLIQWIYNLVWFPSICGFVAGIVAYIISSWINIDAILLINNVWYMMTMSMLIFWFATIINIFGIKISSIISTIGALIGTIIPIIIMIIIALYCIHSSNIVIERPHIFFDIIPNYHNFHDCNLFLTVMFSLFGLEISTNYSNNVHNPKKTIPKALWISSVIIFCSLILSNLSIFIINIKNNDHLYYEYSILTGFIDTFIVFFKQYNISFMSNIIAYILVIGTMTSISTWIIGLSRAFTTFSKESMYFKYLYRKNKFNVPSNILLLQGIIFSIFNNIYLLMPSISSAYSLLSNLTAQLAILAYIGIFASAIKLNIKNKINLTIIYSSYIGILGCVIGIIIGFLSTTNSNKLNELTCNIILSIGIVLTIIILMIRVKKTL